jgi:glycosyltransferase involved in cell wall biosynthesis
MARRPKVFMPRLLDREQLNAQNINAKSLLPYLSDRMDIISFQHGEVDEEISSRCEIIQLWPWRMFQYHILIRYLFPYDAIFYPGHSWYDAWGLKIRKLLKIPGVVVSTLEGIPWLDASQKKELEEAVGHEIHTQSLSASKYYLQVLSMADHVVAISPFLATVGEHLFGEKFMVIPLGVPSETFFSNDSKEENMRPIVICAGTVYELKRPWSFVDLAEAMTDASFVWFGASRGELINELHEHIRDRKISNIEFKGDASPEELADALRNADLFVLPSVSEGVPKVSQEAAACGLPIVLFGHYESPSLVSEQNGLQVWNDDELLDAVRVLLTDRAKRVKMGRKSATMAQKTGWKSVAPQWVSQILMWVKR